MRLVRALLCYFRGHDWRARRFLYQGSYCEACERCGTARHDHAWEDCRCSKCGTPREADDPAHAWNGCTCGLCGLERHQWVAWNQGRKCRLCGEQFLSWNDYLKAVIGKSYPDDADFVLSVGEAIRQEVFRKYEQARDAFSARKTRRTMLLYQAMLITETTGTREPPPPIGSPVVAYPAQAQIREMRAALLEHENRRRVRDGG